MTIISVASVVSVAAVPFVGKKMYKKVLALLVADTLVDPGVFVCKEVSLHLKI